MSLIRKDRKTVIGILGGGQLARMSSFQAIRLGFDVAILEKTANSPAGVLTKYEFVGWVDDEKVFKKFIDKSDIITLENEFIDYRYLEMIENSGKLVIPSSKTISLIQDKFIQKKTLSRKKIPVPEFLEIKSHTTYSELKKFLGNKFVIKSKKMGYDGYGNATVENQKQFSESLTRLSARHSESYAEKFVNFKKELAVMVVRTKKEIKTYPVVETIQKNHICHTVIASADITEKLKKLTLEISIEAVKAISGYGIFGIELFLDEEDKILINEIAPRPHNSGHYTIEACTTSQFENHIRAVLNLPIGDTNLIKPFAVMINLLGKKNGVGIVQNYNEALNDDEVHLHVYGKEQSRVGRKMGHITLLGDDLSEIIRRAKKNERRIIL
ncbi:5-(carboxyamino)imidazole ribonucleotide synthase [Ignavibacterium sp.]|uniref:5-(carboxyamino)imidazole ribonucleotide synthase n=1 Tax=Ignavibacterium sp. TaxID=2651167 RepID=UPI00307EECA1